MKIAVRYFASVREALGPGEEVDIGAGADIAALRDALIARGAATPRRWVASASCAAHATAF